MYLASTTRSDLPGVHHLQQPPLGVRLRARRHRDVLEVDPVPLRQAVELGVIGDDHRDVDVQGADPVPEQQVVQAVAEPGHHQQHPVAVGHVPQVPGHPERRRHRDERLPQTGEGVGGVELHPHEEAAAGPLLELLALHDVAPVLDQEAGHGIDDPRPVGAGHGQHELAVGVAHAGHDGGRRRDTAHTHRRLRVGPDWVTCQPGHAGCPTHGRGGLEAWRAAEPSRSSGRATTARPRPRGWPSTTSSRRSCSPTSRTAGRRASHST